MNEPATYIRTRIEDFDLNNPIYANATVTALVVDSSGDPTGDLARLYEDLTSLKMLANPQRLNGNGRFETSAYHEEPLVLEVSGVARFDDYVSGVIVPHLSAEDAEAAQAAALAALQYAALAEDSMKRARAFARSVALDFLAKAANLDDLTDKEISRINLGVEIGADVQGYDERILNIVNLYNARIAT